MEGTMNSDSKTQGLWELLPYHSEVLAVVRASRPLHYARDAIRDVMDPPEHLVITETDSMILLTSADGGALIRLIAGDIAGFEGPGVTWTPITYAHVTLAPGAQLVVPWTKEFNALAYALTGHGSVGAEQRPLVDGQLAVHVSDTGVGFMPKGEGGVGLANIRERLKALYNDRAELIITVPPDGGTCATIKVPYEIAPPSE